MKQTAKENLLYNFFIPPPDSLDNFPFNEIIEKDPKIKIQKTLILERSQHLKETEEKLKFITSLSLCLSSTLDYDILLTRLFKELAEATELDSLYVVINHEEITKTSVISSMRLSPSTKNDMAKQAMDSFIQLSKNITSKTNKQIDYIYLPKRENKNNEKEPLVDHPAESFYSLQGRLKVGGEGIGIVQLYKLKEAFSKYETDLFLSVIDQIAFTLTNAIRYKKFKKLASTDTLTGILNRRVFDDILKREYKRAARYSSEL